MPRSLTADMLAALRTQRWRPVIFISGVFKTGTLYIWSGLGNKSWNGHTWSGVGACVSVTLPQETGDLRADTFSVGLSGVQTEHLDLALNEVVQGNVVQVWLGAMNDDGTIIADPTLAAAGRMDIPNVEDSAQACTIIISCESMLVDLRTPRYGRYTHEDQQLRHPGDNGLKFVASIQDWNRKW